MAKAKRHIHKYHKINFSYATVWGCALPDCNHYMPKHMEAMVEGKKSYCWHCGEEMILDIDAMKESKPRCIPCRTGIDDIEELPMTAAMREFVEKRG
jgi:hypothetical protein